MHYNARVYAFPTSNCFWEVFSRTVLVSFIENIKNKNTPPFPNKFFVFFVFKNKKQFLKILTKPALIFYQFLDKFDVQNIFAFFVRGIVEILLYEILNNIKKSLKSQSRSFSIFSCMYSSLNDSDLINIKVVVDP